jgi:hypothetical protein
MTRLQPISRRTALALGTSSLVASVPAFAATPKRPKVLVELFTSQGCSSCPPADKLAGDLVKREDVIVLSYNVDYWDYLGWRDTLAKPEYSQRQYDYARARGDGNVYTPQMVFNGSTHTVGSQRSKVQNAIEESAELDANIDLKIEGEEISIAIPAASEPLDATLWLLAIAPEKTQGIERGENAGESITYHNVVRNMVPAAMWKGEAYKGMWPRSAIMTPDSTQCAAILQLEKTGKVLGVVLS